MCTLPASVLHREGLVEVVGQHHVRLRAHLRRRGGARAVQARVAALQAHAVVLARRALALVHVGLAVFSCERKFVVKK